MGKSRKKQGTGEKKQGVAAPETAVSRRRWLGIAFGAVVALGLGATALVRRNRPSVALAPQTSGTAEPYKLRETQPVLSAGLFSGAAAVAYQRAAEIPQVLDQLYCYCRCKENFGHKSLLTCFATRHGAG